MDYTKIMVKSTNWRIWSQVGEAPLFPFIFSTLFSLPRIKKYWATIFKINQQNIDSVDLQRHFLTSVPSQLSFFLSLQSGSLMVVGDSFLTTLLVIPSIAC